MKSKDLNAISRQAWELVELSKSQTLQNLTVAFSRGEFSIARDQFPKLIQIVQTSIEQGYHSGLKEFETQVSIFIDKPNTSKKVSTTSWNKVSNILSRVVASSLSFKQVMILLSISLLFFLSLTMLIR
jgi:hypothetical protein